jgi:tetratricopeptide (TPR) repeat protein
MGSPKLEGEALEGLGFVLRKRGRSDEAIAQFQAALDLHRRIGNRRAEGVVRYELGDTLHEQGKLAEARSMLAEAERIARENDDPFGIGKILCSRAELEIRAGNSGLAGRHLDEADRLAGQLDAVPGSVLRDMVAKVREMIAVSR